MAEIKNGFVDEYTNCKMQHNKEGLERYSASPKFARDTDYAKKMKEAGRTAWDTKLARQYG